MRILGYWLCWDADLMGGSRFFGSLEEAMRALRGFKAALLRQGFEVAPFDDPFLVGFRAWGPEGSCRVWLEAVPEEEE